MSLRAMAWLAACGVKVPESKGDAAAADVEIAPSLAIDAEELKRNLKTKPTIRPGDKVYLE
jgi:hypothetical protein